MEYFVILTPKCGGGFSERLDDLTRQWQAWLDAHQCSKSQLLATRVYLSDAINQWPAVENHSLYIQFLSVGAVSYVEQPPLSGCKIALALLVSPQIEQLVSEQGQVVRALTGILLKVQAIVLVLVPLFLTRSR